MASDPIRFGTWLGEASARDDKSKVALRYLPVRPTPEQRAAAQESALYQRGDMRLVWVSEGDLAMLTLQGRAVNFGRDDG